MNLIRIYDNTGFIKGDFYFKCHSGLDPESNDFNWIPAFAGMTAREIM
jgi:hypothetical protein